MVIKLVCKCRRELTLRDELAGKHIRCPACLGIIRVPDSKSVASRPEKPTKAKPAKSTTEKPRPIRRKRRDSAANEWEESYTDFGSVDDHYPGVASAQSGGQSQRRTANGHSDVERIFRMLFSWPIILGVMLAFFGTAIWIFLPELKSLVPELPVATSQPNQNRVKNHAPSSTSHEISFDDICFVSFPDKPDESTRGDTWKQGVVACRECTWHDDKTDSLLSAISTTFEQKHFEDTYDSPEMMLEAMSLVIAKRNAGSTLQNKRTTRVGGYSVLSFSLSFPAGSYKGESYPAGVLDTRLFLKGYQLFWFEIEADELTSPVNMKLKDEFFNSIRFPDMPVEESAAMRANQQPSSRDEYTSFLNDTMKMAPQRQDFPGLGQPYHRFESGETAYLVSCGNEQTSKRQSMNLRVYLPAGASSPATRKCILIAPAGTNLLTGNNVDGGDYHAEALPYAKAGMVVVLYSLDGSCDRQTASNRELRLAYTSFRATGGGVQNGKTAYEFLVQRLPMVDPDKVFSAGHSSAGTVSLLLAAMEPRLAGGIAYAPICNVEDRLADVMIEPDADLFFPALRIFSRATSPQSHVSSFACPVFVFHARDDSNEPFSRTANFVNLMKAKSKDITFIQAAQGNHYQSMINEGIPAAIEWLREH